MSWATLDPAIRQVAETVLTDPQLEVWKLELAGMSSRKMMWHLQTPRSTVVSRLDAAHVNLLRAGIRIDPRTGNYYLQETA